MKEKFEIKIPCGFISMRQLLFSWLFGMICPLLCAIVLSLLQLLIPLSDWMVTVVYVIAILPLLISLLLPLLLCQYFSPDAIRITFLGIPLRTISTDGIRTIACVQSHSDLCLCLSRHTLVELAQMQENRMKNGYFSKHELPFLKKKSDWQKTLARDYLIHTYNSTFVFLHDHDQVWLTVDPIALQMVRTLCPQADYYNLLDSAASHYNQYQSDVIPSLRPEVSVCTARIQEDGLHILTKKQELRCLPAQEIRTIVRVHCFPDSRYDRSHSVLLVVSSLTPEEMAAEAPGQYRRGWRQKVVAMHAGQKAFLINCYCWMQGTKWNSQITHLYPLYDTPQHTADLLKFYPDAKWMDYFAGILD